MEIQINQLLIVEDDLPLQERLADGLENCGVVKTVHACASLERGKQLLQHYHPDVILLDVGLPDGNGLELLVFQQQMQITAKALILSGISDEETIVKAILLGAEGYLLKQEPTTDVCQALFTIMRGTPPLSPSVAQSILQHLRDQDKTAKKPTEPSPALPPRQQLTLKLLARGMTYREIAEQMGIKFHTVSGYAQEIYNKLAVRSRSEAVFRAQQLGIICTNYAGCD